MNIQSPEDIPSEWDLIFYNQQQIERIYDLSAFFFWRGLKDGYLYNVKAPVYLRKGSYHVISKAEMERFLLRRREFERLYLDYDAVGRFLMWDNYNAETGIRNVRKQMVVFNNYVGIVPPPFYTFILNRRKYFHLYDVRIMRDTVRKRSRGDLPMEREYGYNPNSGLWTPQYLMPSDELYETQYKDATKRLISAWPFAPPPDEPYQAQLSFDHLLE